MRVTFTFLITTYMIIIIASSAIAMVVVKGKAVSVYSVTAPLEDLHPLPLANTEFPYLSYETESIAPPTVPATEVSVGNYQTQLNRFLSDILRLQHDSLLVVQGALRDVDGFSSGRSYSEREFERLITIARGNNENTREAISRSVNNVANGGTLSNVTIQGGTLTDVTLTLNPVTPTDTTNQLYNTNGNLYWQGNLIAGATIGTWDTNGTDVYRMTGNVGIGTSTPNNPLHIASSNPNMLRLQRVDSTGGSYIDFIPGSGAEGTLGVGNSAMFFQLDGLNRMMINNSGNVGIGTTTPSTNLDIRGNSGTSTALLLTSNSNPEIYTMSLGAYSSGINAVRLMLRDRQILGTDWTAQHIFLGRANAGNVGIGTIGQGTINSRLVVKGISSSSAGSSVNVVNSADASLFFVRNDGDIGIGTTVPTAQLHTTGTVRFQNFGAGTLETDASGNLTVSSDEALKQDITPFVRSLDDLVAIDPITFRWNEASGLDTMRSYTGFSAQNIEMAIPEAVGRNDQGHLTLSDRPILATAIRAIQELARQVAALAEGTFDALFAKTIVANDRLCVGATCITESELIELLGNRTGQGSAPPPQPEAPAPEEAGEQVEEEEAEETTDELEPEDLAPEEGEGEEASNPT